MGGDANDPDPGGRAAKAGKAPIEEEDESIRSSEKRLRLLDWCPKASAAEEEEAEEEEES